jgi:hypothetical protein
MSHTVSVRDARGLEQSIRAGEKIILPVECIHNSNVIEYVLGFAHTLVPEMSQLTKSDVKQIADTVAYLLRPDTILSNQPGIIFPPYLPEQPIPQIAGEDGQKYHLRNNPQDLHSDFKIPDEYTSIGAELFRCYAATLAWTPGLKEKLGSLNNSMTPAFALADATAYLLFPLDLHDYAYTRAERERYQKIIQEELRNS